MWKEVAGRLPLTFATWRDRGLRSRRFVGARAKLRACRRLSCAACAVRHRGARAPFASRRSDRAADGFPRVDRAGHRERALPERRRRAVRSRRAQRMAVRNRRARRGETELGRCLRNRLDDAQFHRASACRALLAGKLRLDDDAGQGFRRRAFRRQAPRRGDDRPDRHASRRIADRRAKPFPRSVDDPYVQYDTAAMHAYLAHAHLDKDVGTYRYSDLGVAVLGESDRARIPQRLPESPDHRRAGAAGARRKRLRFGAASCRRFRDARPVAHWQHQALRAGGGPAFDAWRSMRFAAASCGRIRARCAQRSCSRASHARRPAAARPRLHGRSCRLRRTARAGRCSGRPASTGGFASFVGLRTDRQRAVVLLGNAGVDLSALGLRLLADRQRTDGAAETLADLRAGDARLRRSVPLRRRRRSRRAHGRGGPHRADRRPLAQPMSLYDDDAFELGGETSQLTFERAGTKIVGATLHRNGMHLRAERLSEGAPVIKRNTSPSRRGARRVCGRLRAVAVVRAHIVVATPGLRAQLTGAAPIFVQRARAIASAMPKARSRSRSCASAEKSPRSTGVRAFSKLAPRATTGS